ncbi:MAG: DNA cytosine methyltransferase [Saprospiraceae bacterium]|nr:DNA cytosine methyltransferase [Candidatus Defluviibacterium haderslevense]MBK7244173.1 DNA cytosine methyltransferase [Candidatus Defluviibacterium haderslevense]
MGIGLKAIDFFCSGGGMSFGLQKAGIKVIAGIDYDISCKETYEANVKNAKFLHYDIFKLQPKTIDKVLNLSRENTDNLILIGCTPCQYWSQIRTNKNKSKEGRDLLTEFLRFVNYYLPGFVVVENVPGIFRNRSKSKLQFFIEDLEKLGYVIHSEIHDMSDYGVPQKRKRYTLIANRISKEKIIPKKGKHKVLVKDVLGKNNGFPKVLAGNRDNTAFNHTVASLSELNLARVKKVKRNGGTRFDFANIPELQLQCFKGKDNSFIDTYGRLSWDDLAPTITTKFFNVSSGKFVHPEEDRALSLREGASLQTFPKSFIFKTNSIAQTAKIIGNAVPPKYAKAIGESIFNAYDNN